MARPLRRFAVGGLLLLTSLTALRTAAGERPPAPRLLPESTLAVVRVVDTPQLVKRFRQTALGRITQDESVKPLVSQLYSAVQTALQQVQERVGLPLPQILQIPQGEICVALVARPEQRPGIVVVLDVKDQLPQARRLLARGEEVLIERGGVKSTEKIDQQEVALYTSPDGQQFFLLEREGTLVLTTAREHMQLALNNWHENVERSLADSDKYNSIMNRCGAGASDPPQVTWFVDPIELLKASVRDPLAAANLAILPVLGLDGVQGVGGSLTFATGDFDQVQHVHLLLDSPRVGVLEALALTSGDSTPEAWVPNDCVSYTTVHWGVRQTFTVAARLYNSLMGEGQLEQEIRNRPSERLGIDLEKELLPLLANRGTWVQWVERPVRLNSMTSLLGLKVKDPIAVEALLDQIVQKHAERLEKQRFGSATYWSGKTPLVPRPDRGEGLRQPQPCVGIVGDYLLVSDSPKAFQEALATINDPQRGLANSLDYKLIASRIARQPGGDAPGIVQFSRPEEAMRFWYEMASADATRRRLSERAERNEFFRSVEGALQDHPLPPFAVLAQYLAPGGGMFVNDETGFHYTSFTLKRQ